MKTWVDQFIEWGVGRSNRPWAPETVRAYDRTLRILERDTGKPAEELTPEDPTLHPHVSWASYVELSDQVEV